MLSPLAPVGFPAYAEKKELFLERSYVMSPQDEKKFHQDHDSDPARTPGDGWVDEGGASHLGPATHTAASHAHGDDPEDDSDEEDEPSAEAPSSTG